MPGPLRIADEALIDAWYSSDSAAFISEKLGLDQKSLQSRWAWMKKQGKLPARARAVHKPQPKYKDPDYHDHDAMEPQTEMERLERASDEFLRLLNKEHPERKPK
jgi:hypothetical protein